MPQSTIARFAGFRQMAFEERQLPPLKRGQVLIRIRRAAVCGSETDVWANRAFWREVERGTASIPPAGHEATGVVEEVGEDVTSLAVGDHVVPWFERGFGDPLARPNGFATHAILEARDCVRVRKDNRFAVLAEAVGCAVNSVQLTGPAIGDHVVIVGTGALAQFALLLSWMRGPASVTVVGRRAEALAQIRELDPRTGIVNSTIDDPAEAVRKIVGAAGADVVYEATGAQAGIDIAAKLVRPGDVDRQGGKLAFVGYHRDANRQLPLGAINAGAIQLVNCHFRAASITVAGIAAGVRLVESGQLDLSRIRTAELSFERLNEAFEVAHRRPDGLARAIVVIG